MRDIASDSFAELTAVAVELLAAVLLTVVGLLAELTALSRLGAGLDPLTIWYVFMGSLAIYAGAYVLGYGSVLPKVRA